MVELYKKINKTCENPQGFVKVGRVNPFSQPCFLCLPVQTIDPKSVFGMAKVGASLARVRVRDSYNAGFDLDTMPVNFLAAKLSDRDEDIIEFVNEYLIPLVYNDGKRLDLESACRIFRNINILAYDNATLKTMKIETCLKYRLYEIGYSSEEINEILKQIAVISIASQLVQGNEKVSIVSIKDVMDRDVLVKGDLSFYNSREVDSFVHYSPNVHAYSFRSDGSHDLKKYAYRDDVSACISFIVTYILNNSVQNSNSSTLIPLELGRKLDNLERILQKGLTKDEILDEIDKRLDYEGASKISREEAAIADKFDTVCNKLVEQDRKLETIGIENQRTNRKLTDLESSIRRNCSDTTALRILLESVGWQVSKEELERIMNTPTDKELVERYSGVSVFK